MKKGRFTEEQIIGVLKQHEAGRKVQELARELGVSEATIYTWKSKYGGMEVSEAQRLKRLEEENRRLKHLVADLSLDKEVLKAVITKNGWSLPAAGADPGHRTGDRNRDHRRGRQRSGVPQRPRVRSVDGSGSARALHWRQEEAAGHQQTWKFLLAKTVRARGTSRLATAEQAGCWPESVAGEAYIAAHHNVAAVALANKLARMAWAVLATGEAYRAPLPDAA